MTASLIRRGLLATLCAVGLTGLTLPLAQAQTKIPLRISTPAVPDDWHAKMWTVFKESLDKSAPGEFDVQINLNASLFKTVSDKMDVTVLSTIYLGTRQVNLREARNVRTPADLKGVKLRMPGSKEWLFLGEALGATATPLAFGEVYLALKSGTIDGQDNPLPSVRSAKFYEVTKQIVLTSHLVDGIFLAIANKTWNALTPAQKQNVQSAATAAAQYNNENRIREEGQIIDFFKQQGLQVTTPDAAAFRQHVQQVYLNSDYAKIWPKGLLERINATK